MTGRFDRQIALFGSEGQERIGVTKITLVGAGGLGSHVVQQLAFLGVAHITLVDSEELSATNLNRYVTARFDDPVPGTRKVDIAERLVKSVNPYTQIEKIHDSIVSTEGYDAVIGSDFVIGCLDSEGARLVLNELCAAYERPYIDLASDVVPGPPAEYGGRVSISLWKNDGCIVCRGLIDLDEAQRDLSGPDAQRDRENIYGVNREALGRSGPSVVSINGIIASLAVTEFMVTVTGLRAPKPVLKYYGSMGRLTTPIDSSQNDCYYCASVRGRREKADVQRYVRGNVGQFLR